MVEAYHYYNIFSSEGRLLQVEYALEAVNNSNPVVIARNSHVIVCAAKKLYTSKLMDEEPKSVFKVATRVYALVTGLEGDVDQVVLHSGSLGSQEEAKFGFEITPDILCRSFADKIQQLIQATGERAFAFGTAFFGFDFEGPLIYATDTAATCYPYFGYSFGKKAGRMRKFLETHLEQDMEETVLLEVVIQAILESVGDDVSSDKIDVAILRQGQALTYLTDHEKDVLLQRIADK